MPKEQTVNKETPVVPPLILSVAGSPKVGKTTFALTFPEPIILFSFDLGYDPILKRFPGKQITIKTYPLPIIDSVRGSGVQKEIQAVWDEFNKDYKSAASGKDFNTLVIDTGTNLYEIARIARAAELGQANIMQHQYGDVYSRIRALIQRVQLTGKNLVITHYLRDKYIDDKNTGDKELDGCKIIEGAVDIATWMVKKSEKARDGKVTITTTLQVKDSRYREIEGLEIDNPSYEDLVAALGV